MRVSTINYDIVFVQQWNEVFNDTVDRVSSRNEHHDLSRRHEVADHFFQGSYPFHCRVLIRGRFQCGGLLLVFIKPNHFKTMIGHIKKQISAHYTETYHAEIE